MKKTTFVLLVGFILLWNCQKESESTIADDYIPTEFSDEPESELNTDYPQKLNSLSNSRIQTNPTDFIPNGFVEFEKSFADLNKDGLNDCILIIQDTKKENYVQDEYQGELNRNRRGLIIAFKTENGYQLINRKLNCFASAEEESGNYFYPELLVYSEKGLLYVHYAHGRYGYWKYTFRYQNDDFELIGYDHSEHNGPVELRSTSINFSTGKKLVRTNKYIDDPEKYEESDEFIETWTTLSKNPFYKLSEIEDFETFNESFD